MVLVDRPVHPGVLSHCRPDGTAASQRVVASALARLADDVAEAGVRAPVTTVVGDVVRLRETLRWFDA
ncbi:MAG: hypothetical protein JWM62_3080 [Frankiales bacterium]|nr:hypothetical protein [Frankiales bacterium]